MNQENKAQIIFVICADIFHRENFEFFVMCFTYVLAGTSRLFA